MDKTQYTVKAGDTLNAIAKRSGFNDYKEAGIEGFGANPDKLVPGQVLTMLGQRKQEVPGIGTMTITPKAIPTAPLSTPPAETNVDGMYERAGLTPPKVPAPGAPAPATVPGLPSYPSGVDTRSAIESIKSSYQKTANEIASLENALSSASVSSEEERRLQQELVSAKSKLSSFDLGTLEASEALSGQGRGQTIANVALTDSKLKRVRALERIGLAQEADTLTTQLGMAESRRKELGELAQTRYNLATKRLDIALGVQDKLQKLGDQERDNARQYLLDVVNFAEGKAYDELSDDTKQAIVNAVANSPITLNMVQTALKNGAEKAKANTSGDLRSVAGLGVVQLKPDGQGGYTYDVVVPENPEDPTEQPDGSKAPTFEEYVAAQSIPLPALVPETIEKLRSEYDARYRNINLGKLTPTNKNDLSQAGLTNAPAAIKSYFLNTPKAFQDTYKRDIASGAAKPGATLDSMIDSYTKWYEANKSGGGDDWEAILSGLNLPE